MIRQLQLLNGSSLLSPGKISRPAKAGGMQDWTVSKRARTENTLTKLMQAAVAKPIASETSSAPQVPQGVSESERRALLELFSSLDDVLQIQASRGRRVDVAQARVDVQAQTGRTLSDARLAIILELVGGLMQALWVGAGPHAKLQIFQRDEEGVERPSSAEEQRERCRRFTSALQVAVSCGALPSCTLPPRPLSSTEHELHELSTEVSPQKPETPLAQATPKPKKIGSLLERVRAREAAANGPLARAEAQLRTLLRSCEDAATVHGILDALFARCEGTVARVAETAAVRAASSIFAATPLDRHRAHAGVAHLASRAQSWFEVQDAQHDNCERYFCRLACGSAGDTLAVLRAERVALADDLDALLCGRKSPLEGSAATEMDICVTSPTQSPMQVKKHTGRSPASAAGTKRSVVEATGSCDAAERRSRRTRKSRLTKKTTVSSCDQRVAGWTPLPGWKIQRCTPILIIDDV